jgi:hypothetical protein
MNMAMTTKVIAVITAKTVNDRGKGSAVHKAESRVEQTSAIKKKRGGTARL